MKPYPSSKHSHHSRALNALLALMLVCAQLLVSAHAVEDIVDADAHLGCDICLVASGMSDAAPTTAGAIELAPAPHQITSHSLVSTTTQPIPAYLSRAPPA